MTQTMRAVVLDAPGPVENLHLREVPRPQPGPGQVLIKVHAFGLNRSELHTRLGLGLPQGWLSPVCAEVAPRWTDEHHAGGVSC